MDRQWEKLMEAVEDAAHRLTPEANRRMCGLVMNLLEKALKAWCDARGEEFVESGEYEKHFKTLKSLRVRLTVAETNQAIANLRKDLTKCRNKFMTASINAGVDYTEAYRNLRDLVNDMVPLSLREQLPTPPAPNTRRLGPSSRPLAAPPSQPAASINHPPAPPAGQVRRRADSEWARPVQLSFPVQQHGQSHGAGAQTPAPRGRQASESSRGGGFGSLFRRNRTSSAVHLSPPSSLPPAGPPPSMHPISPHAGSARGRPGASRLSLNAVLHPSRPAQQQQPALNLGFLATDPHPYPATQHAARMPPPGARSMSSLPMRLPGRQAPPVATTSPRESPIQFRIDSYDAALAYDLQMDEYRMPPPPPETEEQRRRRRKGKGREEPPRSYDPRYGPGGSGGPPYYGGPPAGGSAGGSGLWR